EPASLPPGFVPFESPSMKPELHDPVSPTVTAAVSAQRSARRADLIARSRGARRTVAPMVWDRERTTRPSPVQGCQVRSRAPSSALRGGSRGDRYLRPDTWVRRSLGGGPPPCPGRVA